MGWRSKSKRQDSLKEVDEGYEAEAPPAPISKRSEMELGDEGIGLPFNVEVSAHDTWCRMLIRCSTTCTYRLTWMIFHRHGSKRSSGKVYRSKTYCS